MFVLYNKKENRVPIKIWLENKENIEESCLEQSMNLSNLPFIHKWVALMPDTHTGMGMPIGGVLATKGVIIPNAVGVDIGYGMSFVQTGIDVNILKKTKTGSGTLVQGIIGDILRSIPIGFSHHRKNQSSKVLDEAMNNFDKYQIPSLIDEIEAGYTQLHSGSRHFGYKICNYYTTQQGS